MGHDGSHANAGGQGAIAYSAMPMNSGKDFVVRETDVAQPLMAAGPGMGDQGGDYVAQPVAFNGRMDPVNGPVPDAIDTDPLTTCVAFQPRFARNGRGAPDEIASALTGEAGRTGKGDSAQCVATGWAVRRLTPKEAERLQGFPDGYTDIPWRGKNNAPDGPRYKALGNSMACNCMRWIGRRIQLVSELRLDEAAE